MKNVRTEEIKNRMTAFTNTEFTRDELLEEMKKLQSEMAIITFGEEEAEGKRFYDIKDHFIAVNEEKNHIADDLVKRVNKETKEVADLIKADISGRIGERKVFDRLEFLLSNHGLRKNIEITNGEHRTEIDALVITEKAAFIIEVKNSKRDIFIDENGQYFKTGEYLRWDSNIGAKLDMREKFIREAAKKAGFDSIKVERIVVFTNNRIRVQNRCRAIRTCFLNQLTTLIDTYRGNKIFTNDDIAKVLNLVDEMEIKESYKVPFDVETLKNDFAELIATLEGSNVKARVISINWRRNLETIRSFFNTKVVSSLLAVSGIAMMIVGMMLR